MELNQVSGLVPETSFNEALTTPYSVVEQQIDVPDDHSVNGYGFQPIFLPQHANASDVEALIKLLGRDELKSLTFGRSFNLVEHSIVTEPFQQEPASIETERLVIADPNTAWQAETELAQSNQLADAHDDEDDVVTVPPRFRYA